MAVVVELSADKQNKSSRQWSQILPAVVSALGAFSLGTVMEWAAPALPQLDSAYCGDHCSVALNCQQASWVASIVYLGAMLVGPVAGFLMARVGHKWTMIILTLPFIFGWIIILVADTAYLLYVGRFLTGFAGGAYSMLAPVYTSEICEPKIRGSLGSLQSLMLCFGLLTVSFVGKYVPVDTLSAVCTAFPALLAFLMSFMPRSPIFLVSKGKLDEAKKSLKFLKGPKFDVDLEVKKISKQLEINEDKSEVGIVEMVRKVEYVKPFVLSTVLFLVQQLSGINAIVSYKVEIFEDANSRLDPYWCNIITSFTQALFTLVAVILVDRFGRRLLLAISGLLMSFSLVALGIYFYLKHRIETNNPLVSEETMDDLSLFPLVAMFVYLAAFTVGFGPLPWLMNSELFPKEAKPTASALNTVTSWLFSFLVVKYYTDAENLFYTHNTYYFFAAVCLFGAIFAIAFVPETKGKTEEDMRMIFQRNSAPSLASCSSFSVSVLSSVSTSSPDLSLSSQIKS